MFRDLPEAIENTVRVADRLQFSLDHLGYEFPAYRVPEGHSMDSFLRERAFAGARKHYGKIPAKVHRQLKDELALISGVVQFADRTVGEVMTPRTEIFAINAAMAPTDAAERIAHAAYSRAPVYRETLDDIVGMILAFDVLKGDGISLPVLRPVADATTGERCNTLLSRMLAARRHFGVVRGPDGLVAGIVTLEDLIEELVGEIRDEHDDPPGRSGGLTGD